MKSIYILGAKINDLSLENAAKQIADFLASEQKGYITTPNPEICLLGYNNKHLRRIIDNSFLSIPDGFGLKLGAFIFGEKLNNITTGIDLTHELIKLAEQNNYSILILGGKQEIGEHAQKLLKEKFPELKINYLNGGAFDKQGNSDQSDLIESINQIKPDIIFVCLGAPKQEYLMANNINNLDAKLMLGLGGSIDFLAGKITRAPKLWRQIGIEWLWRLKEEPWRWKRIIKAVIIFPIACLRWRLGNWLIYRKNVAGMIINQDKKILLGRSRKYGYWQMPQGGVKKNESLESAIVREASDEIGSSKLHILAKVENCYKYKFKPEFYHVDKYTGQRQSLFLLKFFGANEEVKPSPEFSDFQWIDKAEVLNVAHDFKTSIIKIGLEKFKEYL